MTEQTSNPTAQDTDPTDTTKSDFFARAKTDPEMRNRLFKLIDALDGFADIEDEATAEMLAAKLLTRNEKVRNSDKEKIAAIKAEQADLDLIERQLDARKMAWMVAAHLMRSGLIEVPDTNIAVRTVPNAETMAARDAVLERVNYILQSVEWALAAIMVVNESDVQA